MTRCVVLVEEHPERLVVGVPTDIAGGRDDEVDLPVDVVGEPRRVPAGVRQVLDDEHLPEAPMLGGVCEELVGLGDVELHVEVRQLVDLGVTPPDRTEEDHQADVLVSLRPGDDVGDHPLVLHDGV